MIYLVVIHILCRSSALRFFFAKFSSSFVKDQILHQCNTCKCNLCRTHSSCTCPDHTQTNLFEIEDYQSQRNYLSIVAGEIVFFSFNSADKLLIRCHQHYSHCTLLYGQWNANTFCTVQNHRGVGGAVVKSAVTFLKTECVVRTPVLFQCLVVDIQPLEQGYSIPRPCHLCSPPIFVVHWPSLVSFATS